MPQPILRLNQASLEENRLKIEISLDLPGEARQTAESEFEFAMTDQDQGDLRWYMEDYLVRPHDPAPIIAARIEERMSEIGKELFNGVFQSRDALKLWARFQAQVAQARVEIASEVRDATAIPWELLRDPDTERPLALTAQSFVRTHTNPARPALSPKTKSGPVRILLVICRPHLGEDVPFRSVASRIVKSLTDEARAVFQLDVLRPPTFEQLGLKLRQAKTDGKPYHAVHFDGHGTYLEFKKDHSLADILKNFSPLILGGPREGSHGYLAFENSDVEENMALVDGPTLGALMAETEVPLLLLNACQSAYAEAAPTPKEAAEDTHKQIRAFGSLALEVMDKGVAATVAMRYSVYVVTAAQFVADLYAALVRGQTLGEAVSLGRKQLADQPLRTIAYDPRPLRDWSVPVVYETAPIALFKKPKKNETALEIEVRDSAATPGRGDEIELPDPPDVGFWGRDETLLALDRSFDTQSVVLLHAFAGSGKTATSAEFARWYGLTGGVEGPVLFTTFERYLPLPRVLDQIGRVFGGALEQSDVHWLALDDAKRRDVALQLMRQIPLLWIWDNVEQVAGFPTGSASAWKAEEQKELVDFLSAARGTKAKFLLTSRRDERKWLGDLPARITMPPMRMQERVQLARELAIKHGKTLGAVDDWFPLLHFSGGNPMTLTVVAGQALRDGLKTREQIEAYVEQLRAGEAAFDDEAEEGRDKSLGASLNYGFEHAFNDNERQQLALLHLFQGFVNVDALRHMGNLKMKTGEDHSLPAVRDLDRNAGIVLLDRAAEIGLLTAHGGGFYTIHPALPWFLKSLFVKFYPEETTATPKAESVQDSPANNRSSALHAFVGGIGVLGNYYHKEYADGDRDVIATLRAEEANLLHARRLARAHGWRDCVIAAMQGLCFLYDHYGRQSEWAALVKEIVPDYVDDKTDGPFPDHEEEWGIVTEYRVLVAMTARQLPEAERLQQVNVEWDRKRAADALGLPQDALDGVERNAIHALAVSLSHLGIIQRDQGKVDCVTSFEKAIGYYQRIGVKAGEAITAFNLGHAYKDIEPIRNLEQAEKWYRRSLDLREEKHCHARGQCLGQLGLVAYERFKEARAANRPKEEVQSHINDAVQLYRQAFDLLPSDAIVDLAVTHNQLGNVYSDIGDSDRAVKHYRDAIRYMEKQGDLYRAAGIRANVAHSLARVGRFVDALVYADAALSNFETFGDRALDDIQKTQELIARIQQDFAKQKESVSESE